MKHRHCTRRILVAGRWVPASRLVELHPDLTWPHTAPGASRAPARVPPERLAAEAPPEGCANSAKRRS